MKNIHILPTDNYSPLVNITGRYGGLLLSKYYYPIKYMGDSYQNIYITSDEEIKEGDYVLYHEDKISQVLGINIDELKLDRGGVWRSSCKKIILTTDQDLIKDGVQAIDDEFLQWFVKNPSCESVKIESWQTKGEWDLDYKIIIPQEEPKQETIEQSERRYSEEDMFEFSQWISHEDWVYLPSKGYWVNEEQEELEQKLSSKEILNLWFEQFKKK
jgi:hypothetical protein